MSGSRKSSKLVIATYVAMVAAFVLFIGLALRPAPQEDPASVALPVTTPEQSTVVQQATAMAQPTPLPGVPPDIPGAPRFAIIGDSYTGGSDMGGYPPNGWPYLVTKQLEVSGMPFNIDVSGMGGSGFVKPGTQGTTFGEEVSKKVSPEDKLIVFFGSMNDALESQEQVTAAVNAAMDEAQAIAPQASLLVIAPVWPNPNPPPGILMIRDVLAQATAAHGGAFVDPIGEGWLWDRPDVIGSDGIHPTNVGHQIIASLIYPHVAEALRTAS